jgi:hypothetical protein
MPRLARPLSAVPRRPAAALALPVLAFAAWAALHPVPAAALAAPAAPQPGGERHVMVSQGESGDAYALVREGAHGTSVRGDHVWSSDLEAAKRAITGQFLWFRNGGKTYVVQDPKLLARAGAAWAPVDRLGEQMDGYSKQMDEHGKHMEALSKEMAQASLRAPADGHGPGSMEEVGRRMHEAGKPMDALGKQMGALGKQMERESHVADQAVRELIREALAKGLARPAPVAG